MEVERVDRVFRSTGRVTWALQDVSFAVAPGEFLCLVGRSGCGKSTLLELIAGLQRPSSGRVLIGGREVTGPTPEAGLVFQRSSLFPWLSVADNIRFALEARGRLDGAEGLVAELIDSVGLRGFERTAPEQLSGGMAQRVALARTLAAQPRVLLFDEPLSALDAFTRASMQAEIERLWLGRPFAAVFVTHDIEEAVFLGSRVAVMSPTPGRIQRLIEIDLPRPRQRSSPRFLQLCATILAELHHEVAPASDYAI
ncbi:MAG: ABC transporter ATP-binding protein [Chloroflexota bacterium]